MNIEVICTHGAVASTVMHSSASRDIEDACTTLC